MTHNNSPSATTPTENPAALAAAVPATLGDGVALAHALLRWFDRHGRHDLPWQNPRDGYRVWLSEVMLQQTQVSTVIPYFERFLARFPDLPALAAAPQDDVLALWAGLGYYSRARNLHAAAQAMVRDHGGEVPNDRQRLSALPGIGRSTASAIVAQAYGERAAILDGNVKRVLARLAGIEGWPGRAPVERALWSLSERLTPHDRLPDYTQAIMDLGATVCVRRRPLCDLCPWQGACAARATGRTEQIPGRKPKAEKPVRDTLMLVLLNRRDEVWLQQRPDRGIWGGLWSLPEFEAVTALEDYLAALGVEEAGFERLRPFRHSFSHYHLDIQPLLVRATPEKTAVRDGDDGDWCRLATIAEGADRGLPAPVAKLLAQLALRPAERKSP